MADVFKAVIAALWESPDGQERTKRFLVDVLATQLHAQDINEIWDVENPMNVVQTILKNQGKAEPESRLLWVSGQDTIMACYHIGIYVDQELIGQSPGETVEIAEDMAARDVLRRMFKYDDTARPLPFTRELMVDGSLSLKSAPNLKVANWTPETMSVV